jgi:hypothetical protein
VIGRSILQQHRDEALLAYYELMRNPTITGYVMEDGVERRYARMDRHVSFGKEE